MPTPSTTPSFKKNTNANNAALQVLFFAILNLEPRNTAALIHLNLEPGQRLLSTSLQPSLVPLVYQKSSKLLMTTKTPTSKNKLSLRTTQRIPPLYPSISSRMVGIIEPVHLHHPRRDGVVVVMEGIIPLAMIWTLHPLGTLKPGITIPLRLKRTRLGALISLVTQSLRRHINNCKSIRLGWIFLRISSLTCWPESVVWLMGQPYASKRALQSGKHLYNFFQL